MLIFQRRLGKMDYPVIDIEGTGIHIRDLIRESGHTVTEVSEYLGTSTSLVYRYIRGEVLPSIDRIVALSVYLEVSIDGWYVCSNCSGRNL